jgi:F0F1-type ATP synthase assembly protein I
MKTIIVPDNLADILVSMRRAIKSMKKIIVSYLSGNSMKKIIVSCLSGLLEIVLVVVIVAGCVIGYNLTKYDGSVFWGIVLGALAGFAVDVILFAPLCILLDMWENQKQIRANVEKIADKKI